MKTARKRRGKSQKNNGVAGQNQRPGYNMKKSLPKSGMIKTKYNRNNINRNYKNRRETIVAT